MTTTELGWRERANIYRFLVHAIQGRPTEETARKAIKASTYDPSRDLVTVRDSRGNMLATIICKTGTECVEYWAQFGIDDNPEVLRKGW